VSAGGLVQLSGLRVAFGGVPGADAVQLVALFEFAAAGLGSAVVLPKPGGSAVFAGQGGDEVDVALGVADADPPHRGQVAVRGESDCGGDVGSDGPHCAPVAGRSSPVITLAPTLGTAEVRRPVTAV
jgi:hypothetical protein